MTLATLQSKRAHCSGLHFEKMDKHFLFSKKNVSSYIRGWISMRDVAERANIVCKIFPLTICEACKNVSLDVEKMIILSYS